MKKYFLNIFTFFTLMSTQLLAEDGIVIVLEAPLLSEPRMSAPVLQTKRKGQRIYIPREIMREVLDEKNIPEFIPTFDRAGNRAYIPARFVKFITETVEENQQPISLVGHDPTDYRLEEPIPATYPFESREFLRASVALSMGNSTHSPYTYNSAFNKQNYGAETGGRFVVSRKVSFDQFDRFYFGLLGIVSSAKNSIEFSNNVSATEGRDLFRLGPWLTYDAFKNEKYRLGIGTGFTLNLHRAFFSVESEILSEERIFSGFSFSPVLGSTFQINDIFPHLDIVGGLDLSLFLPHTLKTTDTPEIPELWGDNSNQLSSGFKAQASIYLGAQVKY